MILLSDYGVSSYDVGDGFGHFGIATQDVRKLDKSVLILNSQKLDHVLREWTL